MASDYIEPVAFRGHVGLRVRYYRRQREMTQKTLADRARINQGYLSSIEKGLRSPSPSTLQALAVALDVPPVVLLGSSRDHDAARPLETAELPLYGQIPAGPPGETQEQMEMFPVLRHLWAPQRYCLRLTYDSMEPTLKPADLVLVQARSDVNPAHVQGRICVCMVDGQSTLKRVFVEKRGEEIFVILRGDNPEQPPQVIDTSREFSIQGIVTHLVSRDL